MKTLDYIHLDASAVSNVVASLKQLLADYQVFYTNLRGFHWNIKGHGFFVLHGKFEDMYNNAAVLVHLPVTGRLRGVNPGTTHQFFLEDQCPCDRDRWIARWYYGSSPDPFDKPLLGLYHRNPNSRIGRYFAYLSEKTYSYAGICRVLSRIYMYLCSLILELYLFIHLIKTLKL